MKVGQVFFPGIEVIEELEYKEHHLIWCKKNSKQPECAEIDLKVGKINVTVFHALIGRLKIFQPFHVFKSKKVKSCLLLSQSAKILSIL